MLILDKRKAVEHMVALSTGGRLAANPEERQARPHARTYHRVATYERKAAHARQATYRRVLHGLRRRLSPAEGASPA